MLNFFKNIISKIIMEKPSTKPNNPIFSSMDELRTCAFATLGSEEHFDDLGI